MLVTHPPERKTGAVATAIVAALLLALWGGGAWRLSNAGSDTVEGVRLRIVQPNVRQADKWRRDLRDGHLLKTIDLSRAPGFEAATHIIWPETAIPFFIAEDHERRVILRAAIPPGGVLLAGAPRLSRNGGETQIWNSLHAFAPTGGIVATYDKFHLVPFGEYMPLKSILPLEKITAGSSDFSRGPGLATLHLPGLPPVSPLICYEGIFPGAVARRDDRPEWLLNVTNDAWFGISAGPHQHFAAIRFRAIEEGLPLVRAANNGISGVVDPYGRLVDFLPLGATGVIDADLPSALAKPPIYARMGDAIPGAMAVIALLLGGVLGLRRTTTKNS